MNASSYKARKPCFGGFQPRDTINTGPSWLNAPKSTTKPNSAQKRSLPVAILGSSAQSAAPRLSTQTFSTSGFPQPAPKRQKLEAGSTFANDEGASPSRNLHVAANGSGSFRMRESDGLNGQSASFRGLDAMMDSRPKKHRSRDVSRASSASQTDSLSSRRSSHSVKGVHSTTGLHREDVEMEDYDSMPIKNVASPHFQPHEPHAGKALGMNPSSEQQQQSRSPKRSLADADGRSDAGKPDPTHGTSGNNTRQADDQDSSWPGESNPSKTSFSSHINTVVYEEPKVVNMGPRAVISQSTPVDSQQMQHNEPDDLKQPQERLSQKFKRDDGLSRRDSIDQTDELQMESGPTMQKRKNLQQRKAAVLVSQEKQKQISKPGDGFEDHERFDGVTKHLQQSSNRLRKSNVDAAQSSVSPKEGYKLERIMDGTTLYEGSGTIWRIKGKQSFQYLTPVCQGTIEFSKINKVEWGSSQHVRLHGSQTQQGQFFKHLVFTEEKDYRAFKADLLGWGLAGTLQKNHLQETDDERLEKMWRRKLESFEQTSKMEEANRPDRRPIQKSVLHQSDDNHQAAGQRKLRERMQKDGGVDETSSGNKSNAAAVDHTGPRAFHKTHEPTRATRSQIGRNTEPAQRLMHKKASPPPNVRFSQRPGALGPKWKSPLVYPPNGTRSNVARVEWDDLERLDDDEFLNDNIVSFGLRWAFEKAGTSVKDDVHIFNTYFFASLNTNVDKKSGINYNAVKRWTMKLTKQNIFKYKYLVVPINESFHWYAAIICNADKLLPDATTQSNPSIQTQPSHGEALAADIREDVPTTPNTASRTLRPDPSTIERRTSQMSLDDDKAPLEHFQIYEDGAERGDSSRPPVREGQHKPSKGKKAGPSDPVILILDSFGNKRSDVTRVLKNYLREEARDKCQVELPKEPNGLMGKGIPVQLNFSDCGLYLIAYINQFLKDPGTFVTKSVTRQMKEKEDWPDFNAFTLRENCRNLILGTGKKQNDIPLTRAEEVAIEEKEIARMTSQELPVREASQQAQSPEDSVPQTKQGELAPSIAAGDEDDSHLHRPPTYDGFTRRHVYDGGDEESDRTKTIKDSRPTTAHTENEEATKPQSGFLAGITDYAAEAVSRHQEEDEEMLFSDEPATSSPQGPQHVSQQFPPHEGASQASRDVAEILRKSPRVAEEYRNHWNEQTLLRLREQMTKEDQE